MHIIGIDEAGRGALAGPVAVGALLVSSNFDWEQIPGVRDSKQLSAKKREEIFDLARILKKEGFLDFKVALVSAPTIDRVGITHAVSLGIMRTLTRLNQNPGKVDVRLDGLLRAPTPYLHQQTIVRGDQTEPTISLASIMAKVTRDRYMIRLSKRYCEYGFDVHKGYGTEMHRACISKHNLTDVHRKYFCKFAQL